YSGMADVAALLPEPSYADAIQEIWRDFVGSKLYLTGGVGARHKGEAFGDAFELPNDTAYAETCASIGSVMWNHRLFLLTGESRYYDVLEQTLYNALLCGVSLSGDRYFYVNPLESDGTFAFNEGSPGRQPWFEVSCCPTNLSRFFPSLPGYVYAEARDDVYVNLFMASDAEVGSLRIRQETDYPWKGSVRLRIGAGHPTHRRLLIRIPGWAREQILGGQLYRFEPPAAPAPSLLVNGESVDVSMEKGFAVLSRDWKDGDVVDLDLPMPVRTVVCDPRVESNRGRIALQRGPLVYCVEERDVQGSLSSLRLEAGEGLARRLLTRWEPDFLGGTIVIDGPGFMAIPYYAWANRGPGPMRVWLPRR
ncbi:MAG TPA: beta-L-arabinofuranosidase domain-containing protein, partial [Spirochaetia bacterium]|nr:beta-L-arabinofuranosidase domain-containing protein [Spirochaetia bacterium]